MKNILVFACLLLMQTAYGQSDNTDKSMAAQIIGDWSGTLSFPGGQSLKVVFHVSTDDAGELSATMDSPDQGAFGLAVTSVCFSESNFEIIASNLGMKYTATLNDEGKLAGTFMQGGSEFSLELSKPATATSTSNEMSVIGDWAGALDLPNGQKLRIIFHVSTDDAGELLATMDSPDQNAFGLLVSDVKFDAPIFSISASRFDIEYSGELKEDQTAIEGDFIQGGNPLPLLLTKTIEAPKPPARPQMPTGPFAYKIEKHSIPNYADSITLAGTLTIPEGEGPFPTAILITGSGPQDRDETIAGHKPFWVIADHLTRNGIAVLRMDDRGFGESQGDFGQSSAANFATDISSAITYLKTLSSVDHENIGLIGHSEGGVVGPMVASEDHSVKFMVMLAGLGMKGDDLLLKQNELILSNSGLGAETVDMFVEALKKSIEVVLAGGDDVDEKLNQIGEPLTAGMTETQKENFLTARAAQLNSPSMKYLLAYDPEPVLSKVACPVLAVNGDLDLQVPAKENLEGIGAILSAGGNENVTTKAFPELNHLFQHATTGLPAEYAQIEETFSPEVLDFMTQWIKENTN